LVGVQELKRKVDEQARENEELKLKVQKLEKENARMDRLETELEALRIAVGDKIRP